MRQFEGVDSAVLAKGGGSTSGLVSTTKELNPHLKAFFVYRQLKSGLFDDDPSGT